MDLVGSSVGIEDGLTLRFQFAPVYPNPSYNDASFEFALTAEDLASSGPVRVRILDVRGRVVATLQGAAAVGPQRIRWDGTDASGAAASPGVYFGRLEVGDVHAERKFVRLP